MRKYLLFASILVATIAVGRVQNFTLLDQNGDAHELYYYSDANAIVLTVQGNGCPVVRHGLIDLREIRSQFEDQGVLFLMINSNLQDDRLSIAKEAEEWEIDFPIMVDDTQLVGESLGLTRTGEYLVIDPESWGVTYRGPINDRITFERTLEQAENHYLVDAISSTLAGESVEPHGDPIPGCLINFPNQVTEDSTLPDYAKNVAPIMQENCVACHVTGGIGPWAMSDYNMIRGFAPMIREVIMTKRMPPWHADPHIGEWENDRSLSEDDVRTVINWIDAGAPRGSGADPLAALAPLENQFNLGRPDMIVELPEYEVPATGTVDYQYFTVPGNLLEGKWLRAMDVLPGDSRVVHHLLMGTVDSQRERRRGGVFDNFIGGYAPGESGDISPEGTGIFIPAGHDFMVQMHYTPFGKTTIDRTKIGLYFYDEPPEKYLRHTVVISFRLKIPPNEKRHSEHAYFTFDRDATIYQLLPHAHYRAFSSKFTLVNPDGSEELLLSVPNYDFNWQTGYRFDTPVSVKAGSRLVHETVYDNSVQNPGNPDPNKTVRWGLQSWQEMLYGAVTYSYDEETTSNPLPRENYMRKAQMMGMDDKNIDGLITKNELTGLSARQIRANWSEFDTNTDGGLDQDEYWNAIEVSTNRLRELQRRRSQQQSQ